MIKKKAIFKVIFSATILLWNHLAFAKRILPDDTITKLEGELKKQTELKSVSKERKFYLYVLAGREFLNYRYLDKSEEYYQKSIALSLPLDATEAYINLISIAIRKGNQSNIKNRVESAIDYFYRKNPSLLNPALRRHLDFLVVTFLNGGMQEQRKKVYNDYIYGDYARMRQLENNIQKREYIKAYLALNPNGLENADIGLKITYDLLNVIVNRSIVKKLFCEKLYNKYPNDYSYPMKICRILKDYLKEGRVDQQHIVNLEEYFESNYKDKVYLLEAVKYLSGY